MSMLDEALKYAAEWIPVFPLHNVIPNGVPPCSCANAKCENVAKHPRTAHGFKDATTDEEIIREWWGKWPAANIGIPTGEPSGIVVLDIDSMETKEKIKVLVSSTVSLKFGRRGAFTSTIAMTAGTSETKLPSCRA
jgi:Bifunctional DNA primase/polymerase, N-terminal